MKLLSVFVIFTSASIALAAILPYKPTGKVAPAKASAAATEAEALEARGVTALPDGHIPPPGTYIAKVDEVAEAAGAIAARDILLEDILPYVKVDEVTKEAAGAIVARDILLEDIVPYAKADYSVHAKGAVVARESYGKYIPPHAVVKAGASVKADGVVIARDVPDTIHEVPTKVDAFEKEAAGVIG